MMRTWLRSHRVWLAAAHDVGMAGLSFLLALYLRLGERMWSYSPELLWQGTLTFMVICFAIFSWMRLYKGIWRYASMQDLVTITQSVLLAVLVFFPVMFLFTRLEALPRSVPFIHALLLLVLLGGPRFLYRMWRDRTLTLALDWRGAMARAEGHLPVLLIGATDAAEQFIRESERNPHFRYHAVAILDRDPRRIGGKIHNVRVYAEDLEGVVNKLARRGQRPERIILTEDDPLSLRVRTWFDAATRLGITLARLPRLQELRTGLHDALDLRPIAVEDLLGRTQTSLDRAAMAALVRGKTVLITGAGGTIGGELTRQIASFAPRELVLYEASEYHLYAIDQEIGELYPDLARAARIGDVRDTAHVDAVFVEYRPQIVFHAAAIKHVPIAEENPEEAILTNVFGTRNIAQACQKNGAQAMVMISTDKAVNPANVMGASKRLAEQLCQWLAQHPVAPSGGASAGARTRFVTVRFGNVLGSTGSVVPLFQKQLARGGPLTITHPDMVRYFMTVREAVELVIQAAALSEENMSAENSAAAQVFVLDMGQPVRIRDLAEQMIRLAGLTPEVDIAITYSGLRPGEKLFEELFYSSETLEKTAHASIMRTTPRFHRADFSTLLSDLESACRARKTGQVRDLLSLLVPEFSPAMVPPV